MEVSASGIIFDTRPKLGYVRPPLFVNTEVFREEAKHFTQHGYYTPEPKGSRGYQEYWDEQLDRCMTGYSVGGVRITGDHYGYLNFAQIRLTDDHAGKQSEAGKKRSGVKRVFFPDFWDGDFDYFHEIEQARLEGEHMIVLKTRRRGYSFKNAWIAVNKYNTVRNSLTILGAYQKDYLYPEGTMAMASSYLDFLNEHTAWSKRRQSVNKQHHRKASFFEYINGQQVEKGYKSQIMALTYQNNPEAARGKDGSLILFEEAGKFPGLKASYMATRPTVEDGDTVTGMIIAFGTGGGDDSNWEDFEEMFYSPKQFGFRCYENTYDEGALGTFIGLFVPDCKNKRGYMDKDGNSDTAGAMEFEKVLLENKKKEGASSSNLDAHVAEYPKSPAQAFLRVGNNILPQMELLVHYNYLKTSKNHLNIGVIGNLVDLGEKVVFRPNDSLEPIYKYPHLRGDKIHGGIIQYYPPTKVDGKVLDDLYYICHDPYAHDSSSGDSLGVAYVMKRLSKHRPDDVIVASYIGRPQFQDQYNENLFKLASYYNCKIGFENDRGDVIAYAKRFKLLHKLEGEFELDYAKDLKSSTVNRSYGIHMTTERKLQGALYLRDWLLKRRGVNSNGDVKLNLHMILDPALLQEMIKFNPKKGNFDRVSALLVGMYYMKELELSVPEPQATPTEEDFFHRIMFA